MGAVNILDMRTLLLGNLASLVICVAFLAVLRRHTRERFPATGNWLLSMAIQVLSVALIALRGVIPDLISIILASGLVIFGIMCLYTGFEQFLGRKPSSRRREYALLGAFLSIQLYFTYVEPSLMFRAANYSFFLALFGARCAQLLLFRVEPGRREGTTLVGGVMAAFTLIIFGRIVFYFIFPPSNDMFRLGAYDAFMYLSLQVIYIALTFGLVLMVNRRLLADLEGDILRQKASEAAVRVSENRLARAELAGKSGNWELHLRSGKTIASKGATLLYGLDGDSFDIEVIKRIPLPEYRHKLDAAMAGLVERGAPYDIEYRIRRADTGEIRDIHSMASLDPETGVVFGVIQDISDRKAVERELEKLVQIDALTGVFTRRHFMALAERELARASRYGEKISVMMVDLDRFKSINDTYGHQVGDRVLREIGLLFWAVLREADIVGRVGGEEFAVVLPQTEAARACEVAERLRKAVEHTAIPLEHGLPLRVTVSIGVAPLAGERSNFDTLLAQADKALYQAKHQGRNQVCRFGGGSSAPDRDGRDSAEDQRGAEDFLPADRLPEQQHAAGDADQRRGQRGEG